MIPQSNPADRPLSVIIVTRDSARVIAGCLAALPQALHAAGDTRVIVVDASTDETLTLVASAAPNAHIVRRPDITGFAAGVNAGFEAGSAVSPGCDVLILNAETRLAPGSVGVLRAAAKTSQAGIVVPNLNGAAAGTAWLITRECVDATGPLDERDSELTEYLRRATEAGFSVHHEPAQLAAGTTGDRHTAPSYVCFAAQDWWYHNRAHSDFQIIRRVAKHRKVLVVNSIGLRMPLPGRSTQFARRVLRKLRSVAMLVRRPLPELPGFHVMSPLPFPFYTKPWQRKLNAVLVRAQVRTVCLALGIRAPVMVLTLPTAWDVVRPMRKRGLLFNRSDLHSAFPESDQTAIQQIERELLSHADRVLYVSHSLQADERQFVGDRGYFLDHGVDIEHFRRIPEPELPADLAAIPRPRVGFFGALDEFKVDLELLERVASELPDVSLVLVGDGTSPTERLAKYPNVHILGFRSYEQIPAYGSGFDVALMPWPDNEFIKYINPIKLKEYLALGLAIVSTEFREAAGYRDVIRVATDHTEFIELIRQSLADGGPSTPEARRAAVLTASWNSRAVELMTLAEGTT